MFHEQQILPDCDNYCIYMIFWQVWAVRKLKVLLQMEGDKAELEHKVQLSPLFYC